MCGILGIVTLADNRGKLYSADISSLKNRGPDSSGQYLDKGVGFYHTRLAVIDKLVTAKQPIVSECGNFALVCNGEIYNYKELKKEFSYDFHTTSDCEVILAAYRLHGITGFKKLKGMFSFGLYDKKNNLVIIYRDPVGKKPLFYAQDKYAFIFSSSVKAIKDNIRSPLKINGKAVKTYLAQGYVSPDISIYEIVVPVLPGTLLEFDIVSGRESIQYLAPDPAPYDGFDYTVSLVQVEAEKLLEQSIRRRLNSIKNPVLLFSGGIDSTVIAKNISALSNNKLACVGLAPVLPYTYDDFYARYAADKLGAQYFSVALEWNRIKENIELAISLLDQPLSLYSYYLLTYLTRKAREFGNVLFLGDGGDEVFYGYSDIKRWFLEAQQVSTEKSIIVGPQVRARLSAWGRRQVGAELLGHSFVKVDKATAEQQMEARCPYLDWDLMDFVRSIPEQYFIHSDKTKSILKQMLCEFPGWFVDRRKIGFAYNFRYFLFPYYKYLYNEINYKRLAELGVTVPKKAFSYGSIFNNFDETWRLFILSKFASSFL